MKFIFIFLLIFVPPYTGMAAHVPSSHTFYPDKILAIPIAVVFIFYGFPLVDDYIQISRNESRQLWARLTDQMRLWAVRLLVYFVLLIHFSLSFLALNGLFAIGYPIKYQGVVVQKHSMASLKLGRRVSLTLKTSDGEFVRLDIPEEDFKAISVGDSYCAIYQRGWLGVPFKWSKDWNPGLYTCI